MHLFLSTPPHPPLFQHVNDNIYFVIFDVLDKTPLLEAVKKDNVEMVQLLLEANADANIPKPSMTISEYRRGTKENPILYAAEHCSFDVIEALLKGMSALASFIEVTHVIT